MFLNISKCYLNILFVSLIHLRPDGGLMGGLMGN